VALLSGVKPTFCPEIAVVWRGQKSQRSCSQSLACGIGCVELGPGEQV
jgi:hypothetical protein